MSRVFGKLGFIHRTLWRRDALYRATVLLGPPPLLGCALGLGAWLLLQSLTASPPAPGEAAPWAKIGISPGLQDAQPYTEQSRASVPPAGPHGGLVGFEPGWRGEIHPITIDATMDPNVQSSVVATFNVDSPAIALSRILDAGPPDGLYAGTLSGLLVIRTAGIYALSLRFARSSPQSADCMERFGTAKHRLVTNLDLNTSGNTVRNFPQAEFNFEPGLYAVGIAGGCWRGETMVGPGDFTLMIRHPGETLAQPVRADELVRRQLGEH